MRVLSRAPRSKAVMLRKPARAKPQGRAQLQVVAVQASEDADLGSGSTFSEHIRVPNGMLSFIADRSSMLADTPYCDGLGAPTALRSNTLLFQNYHSDV